MPRSFLKALIRSTAKILFVKLPLAPIPSAKMVKSQRAANYLFVGAAFVVLFGLVRYRTFASEARPL